MLVLQPGVRRRRIERLVFGPDARALAAIIESRVFLWTTVAEGAQAEVVRFPIRYVSELAFAPDGNTIFALGDGLCALNLTDHSTLKFPIIPSWLWWLGVSPASSQIIVADWLRNRRGYRLVSWQAGNYREPVWEINVRLGSIPLFLTDGEHFLQIENRYVPGRGWLTYRVTRSCGNGAELTSSIFPADLPGYAIPSPDGFSFAWCKYAKLTICAEEGYQAQQRVIKNDNQKYFTDIAFHPSGKYLAVTSNDETVRFYDTATWEIARKFAWDIGRLCSISFTPDGTLAAAGSDKGKVVVWDVDL